MIPNSLKAEIKQEDIDNGFPCRPFSCPIARAVNRRYPDFQAGVGSTVINIEVDKQIIYYKLSHNAKEFVNRFDKNLKVKPACFIFKRVP